MYEYDNAAPFMEDGVAYETLDELQRKHELERTGRVAADIIIEIEDKGPLGLYLKERRDLAKDALLSLATIDPKDGVTIAQRQEIVKEYLRLSRWIRARLSEAKAAHEIIEREYGDATHND